jgi:hypothetical protein
MQYDDLDKTKVLKTQRDSKSELRKLKFQECAKISPIGQTGIPCPRASLVLWTYPPLLPDFRAVYQTCLVFYQTSPVNNMTVRI